MAIANLEIIRIGSKNQAVNSDSLYDAFYKIKNNFATLNNANVYTNYVAGNGINVNANSFTGTLTITNTGVTSIVAGNGISVNSANGIVTITSNIGNSAITNVYIASNTLLVTSNSNSSTANYRINLPTTGITPGSYSTANLTVDEFGRVTAISNGVPGMASGLSNGASNVSIPVSSGNILLSVGGIPNVFGVTSTRTVSNVNLLVNGEVKSNTVVADVATFNDEIQLGNTYMGWSTVTTTSTASRTLVSIPLSGNISGAKFFVKGVEAASGKTSLQSIVAVANGTTANYSVYGNISVGGSTGVLSVHSNLGNLQLNVVPSSSNSTVWTTQYQAI